MFVNKSIAIQSELHSTRGPNHGIRLEGLCGDIVASSGLKFHDTKFAGLLPMRSSHSH
jgi:hypothetical protein